MTFLADLCDFQLQWTEAKTVEDGHATGVQAADRDILGKFTRQDRAPHLFGEPLDALLAQQTNLTVPGAGVGVALYAVGVDGDLFHRPLDRALVLREIDRDDFNIP